MSIPEMTRVEIPRLPTSYGTPHFVPMAFVVQRIAADEHLLQVIDHGNADFRSVLDRRADAQAGDAFVGVYVNNLEPAVGVGVQAVGDRHGSRPAKHFSFEPSVIFKTLAPSLRRGRVHRARCG